MLSMIILLNPFPTEQSLSKTSTAVMDPQHLKMEVAMEVPNCSCYKKNLPISDVNYVNKEY